MRTPSAAEKLRGAPAQFQELQQLYVIMQADPAQPGQFAVLGQQWRPLPTVRELTSPQPAGVLL